MDFNIKFSEDEVRTIYAVLTDLETHFTTDQLNTFIGSITIEDMRTICSKIRTNEYCKTYGVSFENINWDAYAEWHANKLSC